ncbi:MAG: hypothetical protein MZU95_01225 [Desulfomicrobium escambiense]|nr:hypothetical protein [Desulfomicrobium escambiense]
MDGTERRASLELEVNGQDRPIVPGRGIALTATLQYYFETAAAVVGGPSAPAAHDPARTFLAGRGDGLGLSSSPRRGPAVHLPGRRHFVRQHAAPEQVPAWRTAAAPARTASMNSTGRTICTVRPSYSIRAARLPRPPRRELLRRRVARSRLRVRRQAGCVPGWTVLPAA